MVVAAMQGAKVLLNQEQVGVQYFALGHFNVHTRGIELWPSLNKTLALPLSLAWESDQSPITFDLRAGSNETESDRGESQRQQKTGELI